MGWINKVDKREIILQAAENCLRARGLHQVNIRDIAREAGVSLGSVHYYFPSKEYILMELFRKFVKKVSQPLTVQAPDTDPRQRLHDFWEAFFGELKSDPGATQIFVGLWDSVPENKELSRLLDTYYRKALTGLKELITDGCRRGFFHVADPKAAASIIIAIIDGIKVQWHLLGSEFNHSGIESATRDFVMQALGINKE